MPDHISNIPAERPVKTAFSSPLPLADRRRLLRQTDKVEKPVKIFSDWASI